MSNELAKRIALHNAQVELEALKAHGRAMVWTNEWHVQRKQPPPFLEDHFNALAEKIREQKVLIKDAVTLESIR